MRGKPLWDTTWGNTSVHAMILGGLGLSWWFYGIDHLFLGFLFLQVSTHANCKTVRDRFAPAFAPPLWLR